MIRVLHTLPAPVEGLAAEVELLRAQPGCVSAELYATLAEGEADHALVLAFETEADYWAVWDRALAGELPAYRAAAATRDAEFYARAPFVLTDGVWMPEGSDPARRRVFWPVRGEVRIIITNAVAATPAMYDKIRAEIAETRREQGCGEYAWYESVVGDGHLLLLEVWADAPTYDRHWALRQATAPFQGDNLRTPATPTRGVVSREFYSRQIFRPHYDRWLPVVADELATTLQFPPS